MTANVGTLDRIIRFVLGIVLVTLPFLSGLALFEQPLYRYGAIVIGVVMLLVSAIRFCPLYTILGIKTCRT